MKYILILSLLMNASLLGAAGYTHYRQSRYRMATPDNCPAQGNYLFEELSLKPEQIKLFQQKAALFHRAVAEKKNEVNQLRTSLVALMRVDHTDNLAIERTIAHINKIQEEMQNTVVSHMLEFKSMLDRKQQKKFLDLVEGSMSQHREAVCP